MQSPRDSSIWRSLAVAFGDGLAFGVGMKLTQQAARPAGAPPSSQLTPVTDRLGALEERIRRIERMPAALPAPDASHKLDRQVLDAVVQAIEARLAEQSAALDRRLADLEARVTLELQSVHGDLQALAAGAEARLRETEGAVRRELDAVRMEWGAAEARMSASEAGAAAAVERAVDGRIAGIAVRMEQVGLAMAAARDSFRHEVTAIQAGLAAAVEKAVAEQSAEVHAEVAALDRRTAELEPQMAAAVESAVAPLAAGQDVLRQQCAALAGRAEAAEQLGQTVAALDRRTAELEAQTAAAVEAAVAPLAVGQEALRQQCDALAGRADATEAGLGAAVTAALAPFAAAQEALLAGMGEAVEEALQPAMEAVERRLLDQVQEAAGAVAGILAREADASIARRMEPIESSLAEKGRMVQDLALRSEQTEAQVLDLLRSIGQVCQAAVQRLERAPSAVASDAPPPAPPLADEAPPAFPEDAPPQNGNAAAEPASPPAALFAEARKPGRVWRIPLVSSFLMAAASAALYWL